MNRGALICAWCQSPGIVIANQYGGIKLIKCTKCHHEWQGVVAENVMNEPILDLTVEETKAMLGALEAQLSLWDSLKLLEINPMMKEIKPHLESAHKKLVAFVHGETK